MSVDILKKIFLFGTAAALLLVAALFEDPIIRIAAFIIAVILVAMSFMKKSAPKEQFDDTPADVVSNPTYAPDAGESITIVSPKKKAEVMSSEEYVPEFQSIHRASLKPDDLKVNYYNIANENYPPDTQYDEQFSFVLDKVLTVIKETFLAHTAMFFWYDRKKEKLTVEKFVSSSTDLTVRKFDIEDDVLSKIVQNEEPQLLTDITPTAEADVIRYYTAVQGIRSFAGVPLFYGKNLAGILIIDSKAGDAFGYETVYSLGRFVRIISIIISLFDQRHKESLAEKKLNAMVSFLSSDKFFASDEELYKTIEESFRELVSWDAFAFISYDSNDGKFKPSIIANHTNLKYIDEKLEVELSGTIVGKSITSGTAIKIDDSSPTNFLRYSKQENIAFEGSFMAVPLIYENQNFGVLCFENVRKNAYTKSDVQFLKSATKFLSFIIYSYTTQTLLRKMLALDVETRTLNKQTFTERLSSEIIKCNQLNIPGAVALIHIDKFVELDSLFEGNPFPRVLYAVTKTISAEMTPLNMLGRIEERTFAVHFFNMQPKDVFLWAEKLRIKIARMPIEVVSRQTTFTVSIGIASTANRENPAEVLNDAELALKKAIEKGGNAVKNVN